MAKHTTPREKRKARIRTKLSGTSERPRLTVYKSLKHMYAQLVDDTTGKTVLSVGTTSKSLKGDLGEDDKTAAAKKVGAALAKAAIAQGIETATFHILTPYPGTALHQRMVAAGRITTANWDLYDTRHVVYRPAQLSPAALEAGYWHAYRAFYRWESIFHSAATKSSMRGQLRHIAYAGGWKKFKSLWDVVIRAGQVSRLLPVLETVLSGLGNMDTGRTGSEALVSAVSSKLESENRTMVSH